METLDKHFRNLTKAAFERYGFAYGELLAQWPVIVGDELAEVTAPERVSWRRQHGGAQDRGQPGGGTLVVRAAEGRALELQYLAPRIIERINGFYGYGAIAKLKILQGKLPKQKRQRAPVAPLDGKVSAELEAKLQSIGDDKLRDALKRLGSGALARKAGNRKSP